MNPFENITWTCHICGKERPDDKISVEVHPLIFKGQVMGNQNIRHCNDNNECPEKAKTYTFIDHEIEK